jgi:chaperonin GroES
MQVNGLIPNGDKLLVKPIEEEQKEVGGILLVQNTSQNTLEGEVIAVGKGYRTETGDYAALDFVPGDTVMYPPYTGTEVTLGSDKYLILRDAEILAKSK